jgi:hypothetical protein
MYFQVRKEAEDRAVRSGQQYLQEQQIGAAKAEQRRGSDERGDTG